MRKGQYALVEQIILFALGISITLGFTLAFKDLQEGVQEDVKDVQTELVAEYIASASVEMVEGGVEGSMEIPIPERIASETYAVQAGEGGIRVQTAGNQDIASLYGLESRIQTEGQTDSRTGLLALDLEAGKIRIDEGR